MFLRYVHIFSVVLVATALQHSPFKVALRSKALSEASKVVKRGLGSVNVPLADFFNGTDLQYVFAELDHSVVILMCGKVVWSYSR